MSYELDQLLKRYGLGSPTLSNASGLSPEDAAKQADYNRAMLARIAATSLYARGANPETLQRPAFSAPQPAPAPRPVTPGLAAPGLSALTGGYSDGAATSGMGEAPAGTLAGGDTSGSLSGGLIGAIIGSQAPAPVSDAGTSIGLGQQGQGFSTEGLEGFSTDSDSGITGITGPSGFAGEGFGGFSSDSSESVAPAGEAASAPSGDGAPSGEGTASGGDGWARGGIARRRHFATGGLNDMVNAYTSAGVPDESVQPAPAAAAPPAMDLQGLMQRYMPTQSTYEPELRAARGAAASSTEAFNRLLEQSMTQKTEPPSKAELYFRLASAFGSPTRTGSFFEGLGKAGEVAAEHQKETRAAEQADIANRLKMGITGAQARMEGARADVSALRGLAGEEIKDRRTIALEAMKEYYKSGQPQSEGGKAAADAGFKPGTPQFNKFVQDYVKQKLESGDMYKAIMANVAQAGLGLRQQAEQRQVAAASKLTPGEMKLKTETEDTLSSAKSAMSDLQEAFKLNPNTFDTSMPDVVQRKALEFSGAKDPKLLATRTQENLLANQALAKLKTTFGAAPTEGERKILMDLSGIGSKSIEERAVIIKNAYKALNSAADRQSRRLRDINEGRYRETVEPAPAASEGP